MKESKLKGRLQGAGTEASEEKPTRKSARLAGAKLVTDSAQQIWLAGLGAFSKAQAEGGKVFEALVKEGEVFESRTRDQFDDQIKAAQSRVEGLKSRAAGKWDKLEQVFEDRVSRALSRLGVPTRDDLEALKAQVDALGKQIDALAEAGSKPSARKVRAKTTKARARKPAKPSGGEPSAG